MGVEILGEKVVLFRDSQGAIQCLHDVCPHRGAPLHRVGSRGGAWLPACFCLCFAVSSIEGAESRRWPACIPRAQMSGLMT